MQHNCDYFLYMLDNKKNRNTHILFCTKNLLYIYFITTKYSLKKVTKSKIMISFLKTRIRKGTCLEAKCFKYEEAINKVIFYKNLIIVVG